MKRPGPDTVRRALRILINSLIGLTVAAAAVIILLLICGFRFYVVITGSMEPELPVGSMCLVSQRYDFHDIRCGDIITFRASDKTVVTHRAVRIQDNAVYTMGDANTDEDEEPVTKKNYLGKCILNIPGLGIFVQFLRSIYGMIAATGMILLLIIADQMMDKRNTEKNAEEEVHEENK